MQAWTQGRPPSNALKRYGRCKHKATFVRQAANSNGLASRADKPRDTPFKSKQDIEHAKESSHLFRGLLRECTYLPDSSVRTWMRRYVRGRFERYNGKARVVRDDRDVDQRERSKLHEARQGLGTLRRANEGERKPLLKVLLMAYGRTGKRRHELMLPLMPTKASDASDNDRSPASKSLAEAMKDGGQDQPTTPAPSTRPPSAAEVNKGAWTAHVPNFTPQMRALLESQVKLPPPHLTRPVLRRLQPRIEEHNAWQRPMPLVRVKNQTKAWYADVLERTHPPLPMAEWQRLFDLATGKKRENFVLRRTPAGLARKSALEMTVLYGKTPAKMAFGNSEAHQLTQRYMRHLWSQVFAQCPVMEWYVKTSTWKVTWGEQALLEHASSNGKVPIAPAAVPVDDVAVSNRNS